MEFGSPVPEVTGFSVHISEGSLGSTLPNKENDHPPATSSTAENDTPESSEVSAQPVVSDAEEESMVESLPALEEKEEEELGGEPIHDLSNVFGHERPSGGGGSGEPGGGGNPEAMATGVRVIQEGVW